MIVVSLTTTSRRLLFCRAALISLFSQSRRPDKIFVWLSKDKYLRDEGVEDLRFVNAAFEILPEGMRDIVSFEWVENTGPYRKLIPFLQSELESDIVVTADDDIFYGESWLELLIANFDPGSRVVHAARVRKKIKNPIGRYAGYVFWPIIKRPIVLSDDWIVTYGGGAVLCKSWFSKELINDKGYLRVAPTADDLWYSKICQLSNVKVKVVPEALEQLNFIQHDDGLVNHNYPIASGFVSKLKCKLIDYPLNYLRIVKFGNDKAYDAIEEYFHMKCS